MNSGDDTGRLFGITAILVLLVGALAPVAAAPAESAPDGRPRVEGSDDDCAVLATGTPHPDPESDRLGWENGCWFDASLAVDWSDGLNRTELRAVLSRTMARVERIRELEFVRNVSIIVDHWPNEQEIQQPTFARHRRYEALFLLAEGRSYVEVIGGSRTSSAIAVPAGPTRIRVYANDTESPRLRAWILAHELVHVLQHQHFDPPKRELGMPLEKRMAHGALTEGAAQYVQHLYERRCRDDWTCGPVTRPNFTDVHPALMALDVFPYTEGMAFVRRVRQRGGWAAVNDLYDRPPRSTEQVIHPGKYGTDPPVTANISIDGFASGGWRRATFEGPQYASVGEAGIFVMFARTAWDDDGRRLIDRRPFVNRYDEPPVSFDPYNYTHRWSAGWEGDRMAFYTNANTAADEGAYVWKIRWETVADAREFLRGYRRLLRLRGARRIEGRDHVWRIPEERAFDDVYRVNRTGRTVVIVNAPTLDDLSVLLGEGERTTTAASATTTSVPTRTTSVTTRRTLTTASTPDAPETPGGGTVGFTAPLAVGALVAGLLIRRHDPPDGGR